MRTDEARAAGYEKSHALKNSPENTTTEPVSTGSVEEDTIPAFLTERFGWFGRSDSPPPTISSLPRLLSWQMYSKSSWLVLQLIVEACVHGAV